MKWRALLPLPLVLFLALNALPSRPHPQPPQENYLARYHSCTEQHWGWPLPIYFRYPAGYVNPAEWLPWDVDPIYSRWQFSNFDPDLSVAIILTVLALFAFIKPRAKFLHAFPVLLPSKPNDGWHGRACVAMGLGD